MRFFREKLTLSLCSVMVPLVLSQCDMYQQIINNETVQTIITTTEHNGTPTEVDTTDLPVRSTEPPQPPVTENGGLYAYYPFNGNAKDETGKGHDGSVSGAVLTDDRMGNPNSAYLFDGVNDYIIVENMKTFPAKNVPRSITGWFKSSKKDPYIMMPFGFGCMEDEYNFQAGIGPNYDNGETEFRVNGWGDDYDWRTGVKASEFLDGKWHHCAVTYDGTTTKIYFDGILRNATTTYRYIIAPENMHLVIGREIDLDEWDFDGALDDIHVYTKALTDAEIIDMAAPPTPQETK
jgi:hypothetical protein